MPFPIKSKLIAGITFLFLVVLTISLLGIIFVNRLANDSSRILKDNYNTLLYCNNMLKALDNIGKSPDAISEFESNLNKQESNITEPGETQATQQLHYFFAEIKKNPSDTIYFDDARKEIYNITDLNLKAIDQKNMQAQHSSKTATTWLAMIGTMLTIVTFSFIFNFPAFIANPIKKLNEGIKEIANKNYSARVHIKSSDEFGELANAFNSMAQKLDEYEHSNLAELMFEKRRIETIIGQMNDAIIGLDAKKNILFINSIAEALLSLNAKSVVGKYAPDVALKNDLLRNLLVMEEKNKMLKIVFDSKENFFSKDYKNVINNGQVIGEVIVLRNITDFKELDVSKTNFIATISHELKTPISSIKMSLKLLNDARVGSVNKEQKELITHISEDADRLLKITGELLDLTQVESGKIHLEHRPEEPKAIVDYAYNALKFQAGQKQINIQVNYEPGLPKVNCDLEKTSWVMVNFLSNAIRHSPEKSNISIEVKKENEEVIFSVKDSGKGIDLKYKDKIFEKFYQVPNTETGKTGTGLGLAISKDFIEAQGGKIWMESEIGSGSTFSFSLTS